MGNQVISGRYATALMNLCNNNVTQAKTAAKGLERFTELFSIPQAAAVLKSPVMPKDLKKSLLHYALSTVPDNQLLLAYADMIVDAGRVECLPMIAGRFNDMIDIAEGIVRATIVTAKTIGEVEIKTIAASLEKITEKTVAISQKIDPTILGGYVVHLENKLIDMSLRTRLDALTNSAAI